MLKIYPVKKIDMSLKRLSKQKNIHFNIVKKIVYNFYENVPNGDYTMYV